MIPIVYVRFGKPQSHTYLSTKHAFEQNDIVHYIGEKGDLPFTSKLGFHEISKYENDIHKLKQLYIPLSSNSPIFEFYCIARWFVLKNFARKHNIDKLYYCDDDVYNFCNINDISDIYSDYFASFCITSVSDEMNSISACCSFWTLAALEDFCEFVLDEYANNIDKYIKRWHYCFNNNIRGGVSDMTLLYHFCVNRNIGNLNKLTTHGCFDSNPLSKGIWLLDEYRMEKPKDLGNREIKAIRFRENKAFAYNYIRDQEIRILAAPEYAKFDALRNKNKDKLKRKILSAFKFSFRNI